MHKGGWFKLQSYNCAKAQNRSNSLSAHPMIIQFMHIVKRIEILMHFFFVLLEQGYGFMGMMSCGEPGKRSFVGHSRFYTHHDNRINESDDRIRFIGSVGIVENAAGLILVDAVLVENQIDMRVK